MADFWRIASLQELAFAYWTNPLRTPKAPVRVDAACSAAPPSGALGGRGNLASSCLRSTTPFRGLPRISHFVAMRLMQCMEIICPRRRGSIPLVCLLATFQTEWSSRSCLQTSSFFSVPRSSCSRVRSTVCLSLPRQRKHALDPPFLPPVRLRGRCCRRMRNRRVCFFQVVGCTWSTTSWTKA
jgi:hypothetical protein